MRPDILRFGNGRHGIPWNMHLQLPENDSGHHVPARYGKDTDFIRYGYSDAKGDETSSTLMIGTSGTPPRTWFEGAYPMVMDDPVHKGQEVLIAKCQVDPRLLDQTLAVGGSPTMTWRRAN
jgi:hypothetical protein